MTPKRLDVIDVMKGIGIILVVFAHVYYGKTALTLIYSFHMPLFFIISGLLFRKDMNPTFIPFLKKRFKRLFIPYMLYETISIICLYTAERLYNGMFDVSKEQYLEYFRQIIISNWSGAHVNQPLWFLPTLFLVEILYYFISKMKKSHISAMSFFLACGGWLLESGILEFDNMVLPWNLDSAIFALGFYAFGNLFAEPIEKFIRKTADSERRIQICIGIIIAAAIIWLPLALMNGKITLGTKILNNGFLLYITGILGTFIVMSLSILLKNNSFLIYCGKHSFEIMASHYIFRNYLIRPVYKIINGKAYNRKIIGEAFVPFLFVLIASLLFTLCYHKVKDFLKEKSIKSI